MTFDEVMQDVIKLKGMRLNSIRPGSDIVITDVDLNQGSISLRTSRGVDKSRPISELERIWNALTVEPYVHVEKVLNGSGSSRNQPETIMANLPYIEWLNVDGKKHIALIQAYAHALGTLKEMDKVKAAERIEAAKRKNTLPNMVVVTDNIQQSISGLNAVSTGTVETISQTVYTFRSNAMFAIITRTLEGVENGTYCVLNAADKLPSGLRRYDLMGDEYVFVSNCALKLAAREKKN